MFPILALRNATDIRCRNTEACGQCALRDTARRIEGTDFECLGFRNLGIAILLALSHSAFFSSIARIVGDCTKKEMCRVTAEPVVAVVADKQAVRNRPVRQFPRHAVGLYHFGSREPKSTVSCRSCRYPRPTLIGCTDIYLRPETLCCIWADVVSAAALTKTVGDCILRHVRTPFQFWPGTGRSQRRRAVSFLGDMIP